MNQNQKIDPRPYFLFFLLIFSMIPLRALRADQKLNDDAGDQAQTAPAFAMNSFGASVLCWNDVREPASRIYGVVYSLKGLPLGTEVLVTRPGWPAGQSNPDAAIDERGHMVIVWEETGQGGHDIYGKLFAANGAIIREEFAVAEASGETVQLIDPVVATDAWGRFTVVWCEGSGSGFQIRARRYDTTGNPLGEPWRVDMDGAGMRMNPAIGMNHLGDFVVAWEDYRNNTWKIYAQQYDSSGIAQGENFTTAHQIDAATDEVQPSVAMSSSGDFLITWSFRHAGEMNFQVYAQLYYYDQSVMKGGFRISDGEDPSDDQHSTAEAVPGRFSPKTSRGLVAYMMRGYRIAWTSNREGTKDIWTRYLTGFGSFLDSKERVSDASGTQDFPCIGMSAVGDTVIVWQDDREGDWDIYGNYYGSESPRNVSAGTGFHGTVPISWDPIYGREETCPYKIFRKPGFSGSFELVAAVDPSTRAFPKRMLDWIDNSVENGEIYEYKVEADLEGGGHASMPVVAVPSQAGYVLHSAWTSQPVTIDGILGEGEWEDATVLDIANPYTGSPLLLYVKNDSRFLYLAADDPNDAILDLYNILGVLFDRDNNDAWDAGLPSDEGLVQISSSGTGFNGFYGAYPEGFRSSPLLASPPGIQGGVSKAGGHVQYETALDIHSFPDNNMGFAVWVSDPGTLYPSHYGYAGEWPPGCLWDSALPLGDLVFAAPADTLMDRDWPMINRTRERNSWAKNERALTPPLEQDLAEFAMDSASASYLVYRNGILYATANIMNEAGETKGRIYAFNSESGTELWRFDFPGTDNRVLSPAVDDSRVYCGTYDSGHLYALDCISGDVVWDGDFDAQNLVLDGSRIYFASGILHCVDAGSGSSLWSYPLFGYATPTVDDALLYLSKADSLYAFDKLTGRKLRQIRNSAEGTVALDESNLYTRDGTDLLARSKIDWWTEVWWLRSLAEWFPYSSDNWIAVSDRFLCYTSMDSYEKAGVLCSIDKFTGEPLWRHAFDTTLVFTPTIANGAVYTVCVPTGETGFILDESTLWGFDVETGETLFSDGTERYFGQPIVAGHKLFVPAEGKVKAFINAPSGVESLPASNQQTGFHLAQNFPNPFNPETVILFEVGRPGRVVLKVYNILGKEVATLVDRVCAAGMYRIAFKAGGLAPGVYLYRIKAGNYRAVRKMVVLE
jgi:outer membrane protein assembly factor BamB